MPGDAYMCQWIGSSLVQVMFWCQAVIVKITVLFCWMDTKEQTSAKLASKYKILLSRNLILICLENVPLCLGLGVLV